MGSSKAVITVQAKYSAFLQDLIDRQNKIDGLKHQLVALGVPEKAMSRIDYETAKRAYYSSQPYYDAKIMILERVRDIILMGADPLHIDFDKLLINLEGIKV